MKDHGNPLRNYTFAGRLWIIACMLLGLLIFVAVWGEAIPLLPPGRYWILTFLAPPILGAVIVYNLGRLLSGAIGIKLRRDLKSETNE